MLQKLTSNPTNQTPRLREPVPRQRDFESYTDNFKSDDGSPENRIRNDVNANNDRRIYKFFSNSAPSQNDDPVANHYQHSVGYNNMPLVNPYLHPHIPTTTAAIHNPSQHCNRCSRIVPILCRSCCHNNFSCYQCNLLQNTDACNNCRRAWVQSWNHHGDVDRCGVNMFHHRDNRPQILEITYQDHSSQTNQPTTPTQKNDKIKTTRSESPPETNRSSLSHREQNENQQSLMTHSDKMVGIGTMHVPEAVSLSKEDEMLELKNRNDILIAKYARNYGSLRHRKTVSPKKANPAQSTEDSFPLPLMREHLSTTTSKGGDVEMKRQNSQAVRKLEYKWEVCLYLNCFGFF